MLRTPSHAHYAHMHITHMHTTTHTCTLHIHTTHTHPHYTHTCTLHTPTPLIVPYAQSGGYMYRPSPTHTHLYGAPKSGAEKIAEGDLLKIAERVPRDWQHLGIKLGVEYSILETLRTTHPSDARSATMEMFGIWQRTKGKAATRKALKQALLNLKYGRVANEVFPND